MGASESSQDPLRDVGSNYFSENIKIFFCPFHSHFLEGTVGFSKDYWLCQIMECVLGIFFFFVSTGMGEPGGLPSMGSRRVGHD